MQDVVHIRGSGFLACEGKLGERSVAVIRSGPGQDKATAGTEALLRGHKPKWVICAGLAGALVDELQRDDIVMPQSLADEAGNSLDIDFKIDSAVLEANPRLHVGRLLTVDRIIARPDEKRELAARHEAIAVDMETLAVARVCQRAKVRFLAVRVVSDEVDDELPAEVDHLLKQSTTARRLGAVTGAIFRRPSSVKDMLKMKETALVASDALAEYLVGVIEQLG